MQFDEYEELRRYYHNDNNFKLLSYCLAYSQRVALSIYFGTLGPTKPERLAAIKTIASELSRRSKMPENRLFLAAEKALESALAELKYRWELHNAGYSQLALLGVQLVVLKILVDGGYKSFSYIELRSALNRGEIAKLRGISKARIRSIREALREALKIDAAKQKSLF